MLLKRKAAFDTVQPLFQAAEASVDRAAADAATCIAEMLRVREEAGLQMSAGADMLDKLVVALNHNVTEGRSFINANAIMRKSEEHTSTPQSLNHTPNDVIC